MTPRLREMLSWYGADSAGTLTNLARLLNHGRLAGTGKLLILPVDQGFEHGPARSFAPNPRARDLAGFANAGADNLLVQAEPSATIHLHRVLSQIYDLGKKAGVVLDPADTIVKAPDRRSNRAQAPSLPGLRSLDRRITVPRSPAIRTVQRTSGRKARS